MVFFGVMELVSQQTVQQCQLAIQQIYGIAPLKQVVLMQMDSGAQQAIPALKNVLQQN